MKNKLISINIILIFLFTSLISTNAIAATPRIDLDEYQIEVTDINNVFVTGTVTLAKGQQIGIYNSSGTILLNWTSVANSGDEEDFKIQIFARDLKEGTNTFKVKSLPLKNVINSSNPKTVTINVKSQSSKKDQTITARDLTLYVGGKNNLNAKASSGLSLTYTSSDTSIATVDAIGNVIGRKAGKTKVTIKQSGNDKYNPVTKTVNITVKDKSTPTPPTTKETYTVVFDANGGKGKVSPQKIEVGKSIKLNANKFTREGYTFVGWATKANMASLPKSYKRSGVKSKFTKAAAKKYYTNVYGNINMKHFQLGKVSYKDKATVKNLASKNKQIVLYAVWKGSGPQAAVDWGHIVANEDIFWYGKWRPAGSSCLMCGRTTKPAYVCHTFAVACYTHGANATSSCKKSPNHKPGFWTSMKTTHGKFKNMGKPSYSNLKPGDIILRKTHTWIYAGNGVVLESGSSSGTKNDARRAKQIKWKPNRAKKAYKDSRVTNVIRYIP